MDWRLQKVTPGKSTDKTRTLNDAKDARACFERDLAEALAEPPAKAQTDVLRALAQGTDQVRGHPGDKRVYIATDGLSNTGCADLRAAPIDDLTAIDGMVRAARRSCRSWTRPSMSSSLASAIRARDGRT